MSAAAASRTFLNDMEKQEDRINKTWILIGSTSVYHTLLYIIKMDKDSLRVYITYAFLQPKLPESTAFGAANLHMGGKRSQTISLWKHAYLFFTVNQTLYFLSFDM